MTTAAPSGAPPPPPDAPLGPWGAAAGAPPAPEDGRAPTRTVLDLALPAVAMGFVALAYHWVNQQWIGTLARETQSPAPVAALSVGVFLTWGLNSLTHLVASGLTALVARYAGARRLPAASYVALQGIRWAWVLGVVAAALGFAFAGPVLERTGVSPEARDDAVAYVRIVFGGAVGWTTLASCDAVFRAHGDTKTPLFVHAGALALNATLDPLLIFGVGPFPALGVPGSAACTVFCWALAALTSMSILSRRGLVATARPPDDAMRLHEGTPLGHGRLPGLDLSVGRRIVRVGAPLAAHGVFFVAVYLELTRIVTSRGGDAAQGGLGIGLRGEAVAFVLCSGFGIAASSLVGRRLGAGRPEAASSAAWRATALAAAACLVWGLVLFFFDGTIARILGATADNEPYARLYFRIVAVALVPQALEIVLDGAFAGAGMTLPPMLVSITFAAARVPLAAWASTHWGVAGIWWTISATAAVRGVVIAVWFSRGSWKRRTV